MTTTTQPPMTPTERENEQWLADELAAMQFPCAICGVQFKDHSLGLLRTCFQSIAAALTKQREEAWKDAIEIARGTITDRNWGSIWLNRDQIIERLEAARKEGNK